jgi:DNA-binding Xre family transcriptional regulator
LKIEVRAVGLKAMREKRGLTQRKLAHDLGISQNYNPGHRGWSTPCRSEATGAVGEVLGCRFEDLFEVVLVNPETGSEQRVEAQRVKHQ